MKCGKPVGVSQILIGLHKVGIVGLRDAIKKANQANLTGREAIIDFLMKSLADENYIPDTQSSDYRRALWREFLRHRGEDISPFYSEIEVNVRGAAGPERDGFVETLTSVLGELELKPRITFLSPTVSAAAPELVMDGESVAHGGMPRNQLKVAVNRRISEW